MSYAADGYAPSGDSSASSGYQICTSAHVAEVRGEGDFMVGMRKGPELGAKGPSGINENLTTGDSRIGKPRPSALAEQRPGDRGVEEFPVALVRGSPPPSRAQD